MITSSRMFVGRFYHDEESELNKIAYMENAIREMKVELSKIDAEASNDTEERIQDEAIQAAMAGGLIGLLPGLAFSLFMNSNAEFGFQILAGVTVAFAAMCYAFVYDVTKPREVNDTEKDSNFGYLLRMALGRVQPASIFGALGNELKFRLQDVLDQSFDLESQTSEGFIGSPEIEGITNEEVRPIEANIISTEMMQKPFFVEETSRSEPGKITLENDAKFTESKLNDIKSRLMAAPNSVTIPTSFPRKASSSNPPIDASAKSLSVEARGYSTPVDRSYSGSRPQVAPGSVWDRFSNAEPMLKPLYIRPSNMIWNNLSGSKKMKPLAAPQKDFEKESVVSQSEITDNAFDSLLQSTPESDQINQSIAKNTSSNNYSSSNVPNDPAMNLCRSTETIQNCKIKTPSSFLSDTPQTIELFQDPKHTRISYGNEANIFFLGIKEIRTMRQKLLIQAEMKEKMNTRILAMEELMERLNNKLDTIQD